MKPKLQVLFVEDSEQDVMLAVNQLRGHDFHPLTERVETAEALIAALHRQPWDLIISDYSMPHFNGAEALQIVRHSQLDVPFIFLSGSLGEERAVAMMRAGAQDYIVKDQLQRLGPSVIRELQAAHTRREHRQMEQAAAHLAAIVASSDDAILSKSLDGTVTSWNQSAECIYGYSAAEMIGQSVTKIIPPDRIGEFDAYMQRIAQGQHVNRFDTTRMRRDGTLIDVSVTVSPILNPQGRVIGASAITRDITDRRREERERLKLIEELTRSLAQTKTLRGLLPICSSCKKIRDDQGYWQQLEVYFEQHAHVDFSHGVCPDCMQRLYPDFAPKVKSPEPAAAS